MEAAEAFHGGFTEDSGFRFHPAAEVLVGAHHKPDTVLLFPKAVDGFVEVATGDFEFSGGVGWKGLDGMGLGSFARVEALKGFFLACH